MAQSPERRDRHRSSRQRSPERRSRHRSSERRSRHRSRSEDKDRKRRYDIMTSITIQYMTKTPLDIVMIQ